MAYNRKDYYYHKAKSENFAARSVFKLQEIDQRFKILKAGYKVLDLGAAPGSWSQYCSKKTGPGGRILGIDLEPIQLTLPNALFLTADLRTLDLEKAVQKILPPFDVILSDMAPKTTGIRITDQARSLELCELALDITNQYLKKGGSFVCKLFQGEDFESFRKKLAGSFKKVDILRPQSTRKESKEVFFVCLSFQI